MKGNRICLYFSIISLREIACNRKASAIKNSKREMKRKFCNPTCSSCCVHPSEAIVLNLRMMVGGSIMVCRSRSRIGVGGPVVASRDHVVRVVRVMLRHLAGAVVFIGRR